MKTNKSQLKSVIKECLRELIKEGEFDGVIQEAAGSTNGSRNADSFNNNQMRDKGSVRAAVSDMIGDGSAPKVNTGDPATDLYFQRKKNEAPLNQGNTEDQNVSDPMKEMVKGAAQSVGAKNKKESQLFENIFLDTAQNTLPRMREMGDSGGVDAVAQQSYSPEEAKQESEQLSTLRHDGNITNWAKIAFGNTDS